MTNELLAEVSLLRDKVKKYEEAWEKVRMEIILEGKKNYTNSIFNKGLYRAIEIIDKYSEVSE